MAAISGKAGNIKGEIQQPGGNRFEEARSGKYLLPPFPRTVGCNHSIK